MKIALVTGRIAYEMVREVAEKIMRENPGVEITVIQLPIPVAAMMTSEYLLRELPRHIDSLRDKDYVIVPGYTRGDVSLVSRELGLRIIKGPRYIYDLPQMVKYILKGVEFSTIESADSILEAEKEKIEVEVLREAREKASVDKYFDINGIPVSKHYPLVVLEVYADTPRDLEKYRVAASHADLISIGVPIGFDLSKTQRIIEEAKTLFNKPVGIDTGDMDIINELSRQVDFINGVSIENIDVLTSMIHAIREKPIILVGGRGVEPKKLVSTARYLREHGLEKIILDPVLQPPLQGLIESLTAYIEVKNMQSEFPVLMGVGNITELVDADSIGLNALLAFIGVELGVELYLTAEASVKTRNATLELKKALEMAVIAKKLGKPPKDLTLNLLVLKDKKLKTSIPVRAENRVVAVEKSPWKPDPKGFFKIFVDHSNKTIIVQYYKYGENKPVLEIESRDPYAILNTIIDRELASDPKHYFYLGYELAKAKIALSLGKEYEQDRELFTVD